MSLLNLPYLPNNDTSTIILTINIIVSLSEKSQKHDTSKQHHSFDQPIKPCSLDFVKSVHGGKINVLVGMRGKCKVNIFQYGWRFRPTGPFIRPPLITSVSSTFSVCFAKLDRIYFWHSCLRSSHWFRFFSISSPQPPSSQTGLFFTISMTKCCQRHHLGLPMSFPDICTSKSACNNVIWRQGNSLRTKFHP